MSSIGSTLNSIHSSVQAASSPVAVSSPSGQGSGVGTSDTFASDHVDFSPVAAALTQLGQGQTGNPAASKSALAVNAAKLKAEAQQQTDPELARVLALLADQLQKAAGSDDASQASPAKQSQQHQENNAQTSQSSNEKDKPSGQPVQSTREALLFNVLSLNQAAHGGGNLQELLDALFKATI